MCPVTSVTSAKHEKRTQGEVYIRSLIRYNEELAREITRLREVVADLRDQNVRRELGFPPRRLKP